MGLGTIIFKALFTIIIVIQFLDPIIEAYIKLKEVIMTMKCWYVVFAD